MENLDPCSFDWAPEGSCNHSMDAVVECYGGVPTGDASTPEQCSIYTLQELLTLARQELNNERDARVHQMTELNKEHKTMKGLLTRARTNLDMSREELMNERQTTILEHNATMSVLNSVGQHTTEPSNLRHDLSVVERNSNASNNEYSSKSTN